MKIVIKRDLTPIELLEEDDNSRESEEIRSILLNPEKIVKKPQNQTVKKGVDETNKNQKDGGGNRQAEETPRKDNESEVVDQVFEINDNEPL